MKREYNLVYIMLEDGVEELILLILILKDV